MHTDGLGGQPRRADHQSRRLPQHTLPTPPGGTPPRENWYAEPAQIGDNLYFLGTRNHNTYALVANTGEIILIDGNFDYATEAEIHQGLRILGLDPNKVRYSIYAHAHGDHDGGAHLTEAAIPGVTIVYGEGDWPGVLARTGPHATRFGPQNDGTDGRVITVGDVSVQIVTMPGHTPGTISFLFEFKDNGQPIRVAYPGGTAISFTNPDPAFYDGYIASARKFAQAAAALRRHRADVESHRVRQRLLQGAYSGQSLRHKCAQSVSRRSAGGAELHGCRRALRHGGQAPGDRQPLRLSAWYPPTRGGYGRAGCHRLQVILGPRRELRVRGGTDPSAPEPKLRSEIIPSPVEQATEPACDHAQA